MVKKMVLGAFLGGLALFVWGMVSHMALGLTDAAVKMLPAETVGALGGLGQAALYLYPGVDQSGSPAQQEAAMKTWAEAYQRGPRGILVYTPQGGNPSFGGLLALQFLTCVVVGLIASILLWMAGPGPGGYGARVGFVALLGLLASVFVDVPYWNWYSFPADYTLRVLVDRTVGMLAMGLALGAIVKR